MIQRAVTAIIGVVIGLFATFAVFSAILAGLDSFYLLTQDACNYGSENSPETGAAHHAPQNPERSSGRGRTTWTGPADGIGVSTTTGPATAWPTAPIWKGIRHLPHPQRRRFLPFDSTDVNAATPSAISNGLRPRAAVFTAQRQLVPDPVEP